MRWWLPRPGARIIRIEAEAEALISELGIHAYDEARRKESEASSDEIARDWNQVAELIAARTSLSVDAAAPNNEPAAAQCRANSESSPLNLLNSVVSARPQQFRIQMTSAACGGEPFILKEPRSWPLQTSQCRQRLAGCASSTATATNYLRAGRLIPG